MDPTPSSWHMKVPAFLMWFYAFNQVSFASGMMDSMNGMMFGTSAEMLPCYVGPVGDFGNFASFVSSVALGYMFMIDELTPKETVTKIFKAFGAIGATWGFGIIPWCYMNGIMGVPAVAMFGPVAIFHIAVSALVLSKQ